MVERRYLLASEDSDLIVPLRSRNVLHDMESVIWALFSRLLDIETEGKRAERANLIRRLFYKPTILAGLRFIFLMSCSPTYKSDFAAILGKKHEDLFIILCHMLDAMAGYYRNSELQLTGHGTVEMRRCHGVHADFREILSKCKGFMDRVPLFIVLGQPSTGKRKRDRD